MTVDADRAAREVLAVDPGRKWTLVLAIVRLTAERDRLAAEVLRLREALGHIEAVATLEPNHGAAKIGRAARAALASSPGQDVARYTADPSGRGDTAPEEPR